MMNKQKHNGLLSSLLLRLWSGLGYNGEEAIEARERHDIMVLVRNKLFHKRPVVFPVPRNAKREEKDNTQFDAGEGYQWIIDILIDEFKEQDLLPNCFGLLTIQLSSSSVCLGPCKKASQGPIDDQHIISNFNGCQL